MGVSASVNTPIRPLMNTFYPATPTPPRPGRDTAGPYIPAALLVHL